MTPARSKVTGSVLLASLGFLGGIRELKIKKVG